MFQNISEQEIDEETKNINKKNLKNILKNMLTIPNIILYIISFIISTVSILDGISLFGLAMFAAACSNGAFASMVYVTTLIGTFVGAGKGAGILYLVTSLIFIVSMLVSRPVYQEETKNEKRMLGKHLIFSVIMVQAMQVFTGKYLVADLLTTIVEAITTYIFYKIFVNSIPVIKECTVKKAFTLEEAIGASLLLSIAISSIRGINIYGIVLSNVVSILLVLMVGWKNGVLVGTTTGLTIGVVLAILGVGQNELIVTYALSGMISGILYRFGKIGVAIGIIVGSGILVLLSKNNIETGIYIKDVIIAAIGLLIMPKSIELRMSDLIEKTSLFPKSMNNFLTAGKQTMSKLNTFSDTVAEMAKSYEEAAATIVEENPNSIKKNKEIFINEMLTNLETISDNMLYDELVDTENGILYDIFDILVEKEEIEQEDLIKVFEDHNCYIIGAEEDKKSKMMENNIFQALKNINYTYKISKINFVWKQKEIANKKNMSNKLNVVSKVISDLANDISNIDSMLQEKETEVKLLAKQKGIDIKQIDIKKQKNNKYIITIDVDGKKEYIELLENILSKVMKEKIEYSKKEEELYKYESKDKLSLEIGMSRTTKDNSDVSGDSSLQTKLKDGKYLIAISDGMGSGKVARKSSRRVINLLEKLLSSGFESETSIELINTAMTTSIDEDMYATLDAVVLDMYNGNIEFIKTGACPTLIKTKEGMNIIQDSSMPVGMSNRIKAITYDKDAKDGDVIVMYTDGVQDSNDGMWLKDMVNRMKTDNVQKMADIIIKEAIDNSFGLVKDDMTVIVVKIRKSN